MIQARELDKVANPGHDNTVNLMFYTGGWVLTPDAISEAVIENKLDIIFNLVEMLWQFWGWGLIFTL